MDEALFQKTHQITNIIIDKMPATLFGIERQMYLAKAIHELDDEDRCTLQMLLQGFLDRMSEIEASDIDMGSLGCKGQIWYRTHGDKKPDPQLGKYSKYEMDLILLNSLMERQAKILFEKKSLDFSYSYEVPGKNEPVRLRANIYFDLGNIGLNMRLIAGEIRPISSYGFHPNIARAMSLAHVKKGLILITGITGSGKSSTLDSIVDANNKSVDAHIVIIASPIEHVHIPQRCVVRHREVGSDVLSFKEGTIQALRQDPDIIIIGEMRDPETIITALEVTDSGHKVFSTLHTSSAVDSIDRIIGEVPSIEQDRVRDRLADVLTVVMSQKLPKTIDGKRILAKEILFMTPPIRAAIKNNNIGEIYQMLHQGSSLGMITMEQDLKRLYEQNIISYEEALANANNKKRFKEIVKYSV